MWASPLKPFRNDKILGTGWNSCSDRRHTYPVEELKMEMSFGTGLKATRAETKNDVIPNGADSPVRNLLA